MRSSPCCYDMDIRCTYKDPNDILLAELIFTMEDVREVIYKRLDDCNEGFVQFLEDRIKASTDLDERQAFRSLVEMIDAVKKAVERKMVRIAGWTFHLERVHAHTHARELIRTSIRTQAEDAARSEEEKQKMLEEEAKLMAELAEAKKRAQTEAEEKRQKMAQK